ncbi:hypothetical protein [Herbiconiux daphne]|uniref:Flagellar biosynthesis protein FlhB n=1 Tax=Herbiconiux daphne TaxID=2970914 RepID=A0ABT2GWL3_9MICO|nr:hypothetical protein [Herbiconiux daphne]MCS5732354.1 hypothetical protein [Herbiconiux daphne]
MSFFGKKDDPYEPGKSERESKQAAENQGPDGEKKPERPSNARIAIWVIVGAIGLYLLGSGLFGILTH